MESARAASRRRTFAHLWDRRLGPEELREATREISQKSLNLKWYDLVRPFEQIAPLRDRISELETIIMRVANIIANDATGIRPLPRWPTSKGSSGRFAAICEQFRSTNRSNTMKL